MDIPFGVEGVKNEVLEEDALEVSGSTRAAEGGFPNSNPDLNVKGEFGQGDASEQPQNEELPTLVQAAKRKLEKTIAKSKNEAYQLYCNYAHNMGFSVRKEHHTYWPNSRLMKYKDFVCSKNGFKRSVRDHSQLKYRKSDIRTGCPAMVKFAVDLDGNWTLKSFIEAHNHELARAADLHLLRSFRIVGDDKGAVLKSMTDAGIRTIDAFHYLADEVGGRENVGFSKRDAYNYIGRERRSRIESGDTDYLIQLFKDRQFEDDMFAWDVQKDEDNRLVNFFWVDGLGRIDYDCFGDVVIFDTSYRLNKYNLICAPLIGVNHH